MSHLYDAFNVLTIVRLFTSSHFTTASNFITKSVCKFSCPYSSNNSSIKSFGTDDSCFTKALADVSIADVLR